jgi:hypothetical protein
LGGGIGGGEKTEELLLLFFEYRLVSKEARGATEATCIKGREFSCVLTVSMTSSEDRGEGSMFDSMEGCKDAVVVSSLVPP